MRRVSNAAALGLVACALALASASGAEKPQPGSAPAAKSQPSAAPGEEIKQGFISFGHGIRDGAIRAWNAVKSAVNNPDDTSSKHQGSPAQTKASNAK